MTAFTKMMSNPVRRAEILTAYLFLSPTLVGFVIFIVGPVIAAFVLSTYNWNLINPAQPAGLDNYKQLLSDPRLVSIYLTTFKIAVSTVVLKLVVGMIRSEEHTSELQSHHDIVCRRLLDKTKQ